MQLSALYIPGSNFFDCYGASSLLLCLSLLHLCTLCLTILEYVREFHVPVNFVVRVYTYNDNKLLLLKYNYQNGLLGLLSQKLSYQNVALGLFPIGSSKSHII